MDKEKKSLVFYRSWYEGITQLPEDMQLKMFRAIADYQFTEKEPDDPTVKAIFCMTFKPMLDKDSQKWDERREKRRQAGMKHRGNQYTKTDKMEQNGTNGTSVPSVPKYETESEQNGTNGTVDVDDDVDVDVDVDVHYNSVVYNNNLSVVNIKKNKNKGFCCSDNHDENLAEALAYSNEKGLGLTSEDISDWYQYNQATGWMNQNGVPYVDRKACLRGFARGTKQSGKLKPKQRTSQAESLRREEHRRLEEERMEREKNAVSGERFEEFKKKSGLSIFKNL